MVGYGTRIIKVVSLASDIHVYYVHRVRNSFVFRRSVIGIVVILSDEVKCRSSGSVLPSKPKSLDKQIIWKTRGLIHFLLLYNSIFCFDLYFALRG